MIGKCDKLQGFSLILLLLFPIEIFAAETQSTDYRLAIIDVPATCSTSLEFTADKRKLSVKTAVALYQLIRFAFDSYELTDAENSFYKNQFVKNPSDIKRSHWNGLYTIMPMSIPEYDNFTHFLDQNIDKKYDIAEQKIIDFRKKYAFTEITYDNAEIIFDQARELLQPILDGYEVKVIQYEDPC